ncbi:MAG: quaternary amine ABC transporter ATP-binding protein [Bacteroides sp.]
MSKIKINDLYLIFGAEKQRAYRKLKAGKSKAEILKQTGCTIAVQEANLSINEGEIFVVMGLSGSGKSSLLRCINRLVNPTSGEIIIDGIDISTASDKELLEVRRKKMAMVFQSFGLLPHKTVLENIAFGLELQGMDKQSREEKALHSMELVGLKGYENQMVSELSGGMQQRVGLARALANDPEILLMDEAFSALDPLIRTQMQDELLDLQSKMKKTIVFVTHDLDEAIKLGDRIAIMKDGVVVQTGTSEEILTNPANSYVESFVESVDRSKIVTASSVVLDNPIVARSRKEGPEVVLRKMKRKNLTLLPVVDENNKLIGEVYLKDILKLRKDKVMVIDSIIKQHGPTVLEDTVIEDIIPLMTKTNSPIWVVNEEKEFKGIVPLSSLVFEVTGKDKEEIDELVQNAKDL